MIARDVADKAAVVTFAPTTFSPIQITLSAVVTSAAGPSPKPMLMLPVVLALERANTDGRVAAAGGVAKERDLP